MLKTSGIAYAMDVESNSDRLKSGFACILAANDNGRMRFAMDKISAISKVAFLDRFVPEVVSSNIDVSAYRPGC